MQTTEMVLYCMNVWEKFEHPSGRGLIKNRKIPLPVQIDLLILEN
jgi:hypothetical protein